MSDSVIRTRRPDQEVRRDHGRRRHRPRRPRGRRLRLPRRQRLGQDHDGADAARPGARHVAAPPRCSAGRCRSDAADGAAAGRRAGRVAGGVPAPLGPREPAGPRRPGPAAVAPVARVASTTCSTGSGSAGVDERPVAAYSLGMRQRLGLAHALLLATRAAAARARRADQRPGPAGHPRDPRPAARAATRPAPRSSCPATCSPRSSSGHPGRRPGPRPAGAPGTARRAPAADRPHVRADARRRRGRGPCSTARSSRTTTSSLLVRVPDVAALNALLVRGGVRVSVLAPEQHTLEDVVLEATTASSDRFERLHDAADRGRAAPAGPQPPDVGDDPADRPAADDRGGAAGAHRHRSAARHRAGVPLGGAHRRHPLPAGGDGDRAAAVPADRGRRSRPATRSRARPSRARCATSSSGPSAAPACSWPSSSA